MNHFAEKMACQFNLDLSMVRKWASAMSGLILILLLVVSTATSVWWVATNEMRDREVELRGLHLAEIERLQKAYGERLDRQMAKNETTAAKVEVIADRLETTTDKANEASARADTAATTASKAATTANKAVARIPPQPPTILVPEQVNRRVDQVNRDIRSN